MNFTLPKWLIPALGGLLSLLVLLLVIDKAYSLSQVLRDKNPSNTISVTAQGKVSAIPDLATVSIGVISQGSTPQAVQEDSSKKINRIIEVLKNHGIKKEDIVTSQFNIYPRHEYRDGKDSIAGYEANQTLTIKVRGVDKSQDVLGKVLASATDNGSNQIQNVSFGFDDPDDLRQTARKMAIEKAKAKAMDLANVAGLSLGRVVNISESGSSGWPGPIPYAAEGLAIGGGLAADKAAAPAIEPGSQDIIQEMTVTFVIK